MRPRPILFGEVLFDHFPDATKVLGGAPFNVCWHLGAFGENPLLISRVGRDASGDEVRRRMQQRGLDTRALQTDSDHATGEVRVGLSAGGQPDFDIRSDQAYDFIAAAAALAQIDADAGALLYHGTLATRTRHNQDSLDDLARQLRLPIFIDVNLRTPWWQKTAVIAALESARWAKLNDDELCILTGCAADPVALREAAIGARQAWGLDLLILTRGSAGAIWIDAESVSSAAAPTLTRIADTVGAGDAFSAVSLTGLMRGWSGAQTLHRALEFAAEVCRQRGAVIENAAIYQRFLQNWNHDA